MAVPLDAIRAFHNAFRKDMKTIDAAAYSAARGQSGLDVVANRYSFFNEILAWHANGEEEFVFTKMESVAPLVAEAYQRDHRGLDALCDSLEEAVQKSDELRAARVASAFDFFLAYHLNKEEAHLYRVFNERVSLPEQTAIVGGISQKVPPERFPEVVRWLFPLIGLQDRQNMVAILRQALPPPAFAGAASMIKVAIGDGWTELINGVPDLQ